MQGSLIRQKNSRRKRMHACGVCPLPPAPQPRRAAWSYHLFASIAFSYLPCGILIPHKPASITILGLCCTLLNRLHLGIKTAHWSSVVVSGKFFIDFSSVKHGLHCMLRVFCPLIHQSSMAGSLLTSLSLQLLTAQGAESNLKHGKTSGGTLPPDVHFITPSSFTC